MTAIWHSIRDAVRSLVADPTYVIAASLILALGIGVNIAVVSTARTLFFPVLPFPQPYSLVALYDHAPTGGVSRFNLPYMNYLSVREQWTIFSSVALYIGPRAMLPFDLAEPGEPQKLVGAVVSANFFNVLE